jgi:hypothetical protein
MELISPILMLALLIFGWARSTPLHFDAEIFVNSSVPVKNEFRGAVSTAQYLLERCPDALQLQQVIKPRRVVARVDFIEI